ncbi:MAG: M23 family metallopeptidase, partial [Myxococcales bacterium]
GVISDFDEPLAPAAMQSLDVPLRPPRATARRRPRHRLPPQAVAVFGGLLGLALIGTVVAVLIHRGGSGGGAPATSASARPGKVAATLAPASASAVASAAEPAPPPDPGPWRVASFKDDESVKLITGKLGTRSLTTALEEEHVPKPQIARILKSFDDAKLFDRPKKSHQYAVALDRASKRVRAFEYQASTTEVWQARENDEGRLAGTKLDLKIEQRRVTRAVTVATDLKSALVEAGFDDDLVGLIEETVGDRIPVEKLGKGATLRLSVQEQLVAGRFSKYLALDAIEYRLPRAEKRVRLYNFRSGHASGVFDTAGKAPFRSSWGPPLKVVRVTSKFNPKRMHPVLHTLMPHQGTDMGAPSGTPVYAVASGTVSHVGPHGPSGNLVLVLHPNGLESGYAHLSRFATGLKKGDKVESQQLVGYVGSTGRSTGPHLHFSIKKAGAYIDAMTVIKLNQERVVPKDDRPAFDTFRGEMDALLDGVAVPDAPAAPAEGADPDESDGNDQDNHDGDGDTAAPAASAAGKPEAGKPEEAGKPAEGPGAPPVTDDTKPESAVWK